MSSLKGLLFIIIASMVVTLEASVTSKDSYGVQTEKSPIVQSSISSMSNVALFQDWDPWGYSAIRDILNFNSIPYTLYGTEDIGNVDLSGFDKVIFASQQSYEFYSAISNNRSWIENYVTDGGCVELHLATWEDYNPSDLVFPFDITLLHTPSSPTYEDVDRTDPDHEIFNVPNPVTDNELDDWNHSSHGYFTNFPEGTEPLAINVDDSTPCLMEYQNVGTIILTIQPVEWAWGLNLSDFLQNLILYCPGPTNLSEKNPKTHQMALRILPNPVKEKALVSLEVNKPGLVSVRLYDVTGKLVEVLMEGHLDSGIHTIQWHPNQRGGTYFLHMEGNNRKFTQKILIIR